jgi:periplasmic copper chaperone A
MLSGLAAPLREGESFELTLEFEAAGPMTLEVPVKSIAAGKCDDEGDGHGGH